MTKELKVYIVIRKDLKMRRGKEIAQAGHAIQYLSEVAAIMTEEKMPEGDVYDEWCKNLHPKIAVGVDSEQALDDLRDKVFGKGIMMTDVLDAGRTEIAENTWTCSAIGPVTSEQADELGLSSLPLR